MEISSIRARIFAGIAVCGLPLGASAAETYQTANVTVLGGSPVGGAATMYRSPDSVRASISTSGLDKKAAYTVWAVVWNDPNLCAGGPGGCGAVDSDFGITGNSVFYAAGFVTGTDGTATVDLTINAGDLPAAIDVLIPGGLSAGNGEGAEFLFVIRSHKRISVGSVAEQISTFDPDCTVCQDQFAAQFPPL